MKAAFEITDIDIIAQFHRIRAALMPILQIHIKKKILLLSFTSKTLPKFASIYFSLKNSLI